MRKIMSLAKELFKVHGMDWIMKTAMLFTGIILAMESYGDISSKQVHGTLAIAAFLTLIGEIIWNLRKLSINLKWICHYSICFILIALINVILEPRILLVWMIGDWGHLLIIYTIIFVVLSYIYVLQGKLEVKKLNEDLARFKKEEGL